MAFQTDKTSYDSSIKEDASLDFTDVSVFQGVRADLDGYMFRFVVCST